MQATITARKPRLRKELVAVTAAVVAAYLAGAGSGFLVKTVTLQSATAPDHALVVSAGTSDYGSAWNYSMRRSGTQFIDGPEVPTPAAPKFHEPGSRVGGNRI